VTLSLPAFLQGRRVKGKRENATLVQRYVRELSTATASTIDEIGVPRIVLQYVLATTPQIEHSITNVANQAVRAIHQHLKSVASMPLMKSKGKGRAKKSVEEVKEPSDPGNVESTLSVSQLEFSKDFVTFDKLFNGPIYLWPCLAIRFLTVFV
jgi:hypothetical protein